MGSQVTKQRLKIISSTNGEMFRIKTCKKKRKNNFSIFPKNNLVIPRRIILLPRVRNRMNYILGVRAGLYILRLVSDKARLETSSQNLENPDVSVSRYFRGSNPNWIRSDIFEFPCTSINHLRKRPTTSILKFQLV